MRNTDLLDRITGFLGAAINILLIRDPVKTSLGAVFGATVGALMQIFKPIWSRPSSIVDFSQIAIWQYMLLGVAIVYTRTAWFHLNRKGSYFGENTEAAFEAIRVAEKNGHLSKAQAKLMYRRLVESAVKNVELNSTVQQQVDEFLKEK